jgi:ABC-type bacteriocin/lantibiotic exporter with double-glycine peptidase domain
MTDKYREVTDGKPRRLYAILLQIEYILALVTGVLLGAHSWLMFTISLVLTCVLGCGTTWLYWRLIDQANHPTSQSPDRT